MKKIIVVLTTATLSLVAMNYVRADQGGVVPKLAQVIKQECGERSAATSDQAKIAYDMCVAVTTAKYKGTQD